MSRVPFARWLTVDISLSDNFSFQPLPEFGIDENVICFWEDEQVSFTIAVDEQPPHGNHDAHWAELDAALTNEFGRITVVESDSYTTESDVPVSFKRYRAGEGDEASTLIYHLISNKKAAYWVIGSLVFCSDGEAVNNIIMALMETAKLK